jgi:glycosyltransferase involved in cell wall biosynthesis
MTTASALALVRSSPRLTVALRNAATLTEVAARSSDPHRDGRLLAAAIENDDDVTAIAAIHALGATRGPIADRMLIDVVNEGGAPLVDHAAWVLAARAPSAGAVPLLEGLVAAGGFTGMLAERTLVEWSRLAPGLCPVRPDPHADMSVTDRSHLRGGDDPTGLVVVQPFLHARLDSTGSLLGAGDAGGIASLLRSLGASLAAVDDIAEVVTITRASSGDELLSEYLGAGHRIERIRYGTGPTIPSREAWGYRLVLEREFTAIGRALGDRRVVWHLRMADVGTLAAAAAARRLGQTVVFTAAPDPHVVIDALEADGRLDRARFGVEDAACHYWFRARMVERLSAQVDHLSLLPRPGVHRDLIELLGLEPEDLAMRSDIVPEGVDVTALDAAIHRRAIAAEPASVCNVVWRSIPAERRHLPWILTVGRLHPMKGAHRIVEAMNGTWLAERFNVVIVGGDLARPSPDERSALDLIRDASRSSEPGLVTVIGHLPPADICDLLVHGAETGGVYVCASDKEEFGLAIVEALGAGMAVVAPVRGGPSTYVTDNVSGALCDTSSSASLYEAIGRAVALAGDRKRIEASRRFVRAELSIDTMAQRLAAIYTALVPVCSPVA